VQFDLNDDVTPTAGSTGGAGLGRPGSCTLGDDCGVAGKDGAPVGGVTGNDVAPGSGTGRDTAGSGILTAVHTFDASMSLGLLPAVVYGHGKHECAELAASGYMRYLRRGRELPSRCGWGR
jgi:hypothetical protein